MAEFSMVWRGNEVATAVQNAATEALNQAGREGEQYLRAITPVLTGFLRDSTYVIVDVADGSPILIFGQAADYALFVELGTRFMTGHYQITQTGQYIFPSLPGRIAEALDRAGYGMRSVSAGSAGPGVPNPYTGGRLSSLLPAALSEAPLNP